MRDNILKAEMPVKKEITSSNKFKLIELLKFSTQGVSHLLNDLGNQKGFSLQGLSNALNSIKDLENNKKQKSSQKKLIITDPK
jgi:hypothetical protein